jgi:putative transferase (TIGR04331 family)
MNLITLNINDSLLKKKKFKKNSLLIGDWCDVPHNIFIYKNNYRIAKSVYRFHNDNLKKKDEINYIRQVYNKILYNLFISLNKYHKENFNKKYWEILVHRWLYFYVAHMFARWQLLKKILNKNSIEILSAINFGPSDFRPTDTWHAHNIMYSSNNYWDTWVFTEIIKENYGKITIDYLDINKKKIKEKIKIHSDPVEFYDQKNILFFKKIFLYKFYIPKLLKLKIILNNFQIFLFKRKKLFFFNKLDNKLDNNFIYTYNKTTDKFYNFANKMLSKNIPRIFIEDYKRLQNETEKLNWPKNPDYILTTHGQYYDEAFKLYTAKKIITGSKLLIAQHGSVNISANTLFGNDYDKKISDRYLTWGWKDSKKTYPFFITTIQGIYEKRFQFSKNKKILLILYNLKHALIKSPNGYQSDLGKKKLLISIIINFLEGLNKNIFKEVNAKVLSMDSPNVVKNSILYKFPKLKFIETNKLAYMLRNKFNLQIETILSTGFFEAMYVNRPVILLFNEIIIDGVNKNFKKYINLLKNNNILFTEPKKAADFINKEYHNIHNWWSSISVQQARRQFCQNYASHSDNPLLEFNKSLLFK